MKINRLICLFLFFLPGCAHFDGSKEASYRPDLGHGEMYQFKLYRK